MFEFWGGMRSCRHQSCFCGQSSGKPLKSWFREIKPSTAHLHKPTCLSCLSTRFTHTHIHPPSSAAHTLFGSLSVFLFLLSLTFLSLALRKTHTLKPLRNLTSQKIWLRPFLETQQHQLCRDQTRSVRLFLLFLVTMNQMTILPTRPCSPLRG